MATNEATAAASAAHSHDTDTATTATAAPSTSTSNHQRQAGDDEALPDADAQATAEQTKAGDDAAQPSQPPPPPPPGPRAGRLQDLFASSLRHTLAKVSWDNFAACYPTAAARAPQALKAVHRAMVDRLAELCAAEFAVVLRNRDVVRRLNELEVLSAAAADRRQKSASSSTGAPPAAPAPPHTLPAETVLAAHLAPQRRAQRALLRERLQAAQAANAERFARLAAQRVEAEQLAGALERALADAAGAAALLDGDALAAELARETRAAEVEMSEI